MKPAHWLLRVLVPGIGAAAVVCTMTAAPAGAGLVGYWKLDETAGVAASDSSGKANHGTLVDGGTWDSGGVFNGAVALDGLNDRIHVPSVSDLKYTGGDLTLSAWVYLNAGETSGRVISKPWNWNGRYNYVLMVSGANTQVSFTLGNSKSSAGVDKPIYSPAYPGFTQAWHHLAATVDSSRNMRLYVDGNLAASDVNPITDWTGDDFNIPLVLGSLYPYGSGWAGNTAFSLDGKIDDAAIWNQALSGGQIKALARKISTPLDAAQLIDGVTYTYGPFLSSQPSPAYPDTGGTELTDITLGPGWGDSAFVGFADPSGFNGDDGNPHPQVNFDLHGLYWVGRVRIDYAVGHGAGIDAPDRVDVLIYGDAGFTNLLQSTSHAGFTDVDGVRSLTIDFPFVHARYVRLNFFNDQEWTFLSEVTFFERVPEPSSFALLACAALTGLVFRAWRRPRRRG